MSGNEPLSHASVREFLVKNNGKVKNIDLVTHFRQQLNDPANKSKARGEFKEIVHTIATVQTIDGEKYFVLKRPKEAPAVMRKPPRPSTRQARPVSGPPAFRGAKLEEVHIGGAPGLARSHSGDESPELSHANKENRLDRRDGGNSVRNLVHTGSVDSGLDTDAGSIGSQSGSNTQLALIQKVFLHPGKGADNLDRLSQVSSEEMDLIDEDMEGDELMGPTVQLEPLEKEWLITTAKGNRAQIMCLLEQDPNLAAKKDFILGYSALHWAAKHGRDDIVKLLAGTGIDVNLKTNGGYTPLHLAAMHGHDAVIKMLVAEFEADINVRDYSGRKPKQVAKDTLTIEAQGQLEHFRGYSDTSSESSGYGSQHSKYGSTNSMTTPSAVLASHYGSEKGSSKNEASDDKTRTRTTSIGRFLKKKPKKERTPLPNLPHQSSAAAGLLISSPVSLERGSSFDQSPSLAKRTHSDPNLLKSTGV